MAAAFNVYLYVYLNQHKDIDDILHTFYETIDNMEYINTSLHIKPRPLTKLVSLYEPTLSVKALIEIMLSPYNNNIRSQNDLVDLILKLINDKSIVFKNCKNKDSVVNLDKDEILRHVLAYTLMHHANNSMLTFFYGTKI